MAAEQQQAALISQPESEGRLKSPRFLTSMIIFDHRPAGNLPSGQRSGDPPRSDKWVVYCYE